MKYEVVYNRDKDRIEVRLDIPGQVSGSFISGEIMRNDPDRFSYLLAGLLNNLS